MQKIYTEAIDTINAGNEVPKVIGDFKISWTNSDGWRGYYEGKPKRGTGWIKVFDNWCGGNWSDVPEGNSADDIKKMVDKLEKKCGEVAILILPTSNVFSTGIEVYAKK